MTEIPATGMDGVGNSPEVPALEPCTPSCPRPHRVSSGSVPHPRPWQSSGSEEVVIAQVSGSELTAEFHRLTLISVPAREDLDLPGLAQDLRIR